MKEHIFLASPHMSEEGYEKQYIEEAFAKNFIAPLGENVTGFEVELGEKVGARQGGGTQFRYFGNPYGTDGAGYRSRGCRIYAVAYIFSVCQSGDVCGCGVGIYR